MRSFTIRRFFIWEGDRLMSNPLFKTKHWWCTMERFLAASKLAGILFHKTTGYSFFLCSAKSQILKVSARLCWNRWHEISRAISALCSVTSDVAKLWFTKTCTANVLSSSRQVNQANCWFPQLCLPRKLTPSSRWEPIACLYLTRSKVTYSWSQQTNCLPHTGSLQNQDLRYP